MSSLHITKPDGEQFEAEMGVVQQMLERGELEPEAQYWREGMPEWMPVSDLLGAPPPVFQTAPQESRGWLTEDVRSISGTLIVLLWIGFFLDAVSLILLGTDMSLYDGDFTIEELKESDMRLGLLSSAGLISFVLTVLVFLRWVYRTNGECRKQGGALKFSPAWAAASYLTPVFNLFVPYQSMKEVWVASHGNAGKKPLVGLIEAWWGLWVTHWLLVLWMALQGKAMQGRGVETDEEAIAFFLSGIGAVVASMLLTVVMIQIVTVIAKNLSRAD